MGYRDYVGTDETITDARLQALPGAFTLKEASIKFSEITGKTFKITSKALWRRG